MDWEQGIVSRNPEVLNGDLVFAGTRVPVRNLVDYLGSTRLSDLEPHMREVARLIEELDQSR